MRVRIRAIRRGRELVTRCIRWRRRLIRVNRHVDGVEMSERRVKLYWRPSTVTVRTIFPGRVDHRVSAAIARGVDAAH